MAAGLFVSGAMLLLGATGAMGVLHAAVPPAVIRGVQLAVGLSLAQKVRRADGACQLSSSSTPGQQPCAV